MSKIVLEVISFERSACNGIPQEEYKLKLYDNGYIRTTWLFRPIKAITIRVGAVIEYTEIIDYVSLERVKEILEKDIIVQSNKPKAVKQPVNIPYFRPKGQEKTVVRQLSLF